MQRSQPKKLSELFTKFNQIKKKEEVGFYVTRIRHLLKLIYTGLQCTKLIHTLYNYLSKLTLKYIYITWVYLQRNTYLYKTIFYIFLYITDIVWSKYTDF